MVVKIKLKTNFIIVFISRLLSQSLRVFLEFLVDIKF